MSTRRIKKALLRPHELADAERMNAWENDPVLRRLSDGTPLRRAGFRREGVLRQAICLAGEFHDEHLYGLLCSDWVKRADK